MLLDGYKSKKSSELSISNIGPRGKVSSENFYFMDNENDIEHNERNVFFSIFCWGGRGGQDRIL